MADIFAEFKREGWTLQQWAAAMRGAYLEQRAQGVDEPIVDSHVAWQYHKRITLTQAKQHYATVAT